MKTIRVSKQARSLNALLKRAHRENVILRSADGDEFILAEIDDFSREIELTRQNKQLLKLFHIEKSLVFFTTSLKSNMFLLERLKRIRVFQMDEASESLLEDIFIECRQAIEMSNIYSDILSGMMDAFASVISNNLNIVMKLLTSLTIIMTIPVLVASIFGMNVKLPMQDHPYAFLLIMGISVTLSLAAVIYFLRRRWLES